MAPQFKDSLKIHIPALSLALLWGLVLLCFVHYSPAGWWHPVVPLVLCFVGSLTAFGRFESATDVTLPLAISFGVLHFFPELRLMTATQWSYYYLSFFCTLLIGEGSTVNYTYGLSSTLYKGIAFLGYIILGNVLIDLNANVLAIGVAITGALSFTLQPFLYRLFIARPAEKGLPPYTMLNVFRSAIIYLAFAAFCFLLEVLLLLATVCFVPVRVRHHFGCWMLNKASRTLLSLLTYIGFRHIGSLPDGNKPSIIVVNHQSFIDILCMIALSPKIVMVIKGWVRESPIFGFMVRQVGYICVKDGYEEVVEQCRERMNEGFSVVIFPEGTRFPDGILHRYHKGAFYLAEQLNADIVPILIYGNHYVMPKLQLFNMCRGTSYIEFLPAIHATDDSYGVGYHDREKSISAYLHTEYDKLVEEYQQDTNNRSYYHRLISNYILKGPVTEWYMRIKVLMEHDYLRFHNLIPKSGQITDIGCGMGPLCMMLSMFAPGRKILGLDYDIRKITLAQHCWMKSNNLHFDWADAVNCDFPDSDVFILNDMLHYLPVDAQYAVIQRCTEKLNQGGMIIVRDGDAQNTEHHGLTKFTEFLSTKVARFNQTAGKLNFVGADTFNKMAEINGLQVTSVKNDNYTSNTIYIFKRKDV